MRDSVLLALLIQVGVLLAATPGFCQVNHAGAPGAVAVPNNGGLVDDVSSLERSVYGHPTADALAARIAHLELETLGRLQTGSLRSRVDWLQHVVQKTEPSDELQGAKNAGGTLHLDPKIEQNIPAPFKPEAAAASAASSAEPIVAPVICVNQSLFAADGTPASADHPLLQGAVDESLVTAGDEKSQTGLQGGASVVTLPTVAQDSHAKSHRFRHELGASMGTTLKAAGLVAAAALIVAGGVSVGGTLGSGGFFGASEHRDLCACHFVQPHIHR